MIYMKHIISRMFNFLLNNITNSYIFQEICTMQKKTVMHSVCKSVILMECFRIVSFLMALNSTTSPPRIVSVLGSITDPFFS